MAKHSSHILDLARKGAEHRYQELKAEIAALVKHFPHLAAEARQGASRAVTKGWSTVEAEAKQVGRGISKLSADARTTATALSAGGKAAWKELAPRPRRTMSAKARKAISDAQKKRWAAKKAGEKKK